MHFTDRADAGRQLAVPLADHLYESAIVYAMAPGGVSVAAEIALAHHLPLDLIIAREIADPLDPGSPAAAVAESGQAVFDIAERPHLDAMWLEERVLEARSRALDDRQRWGAGYPRRRATGQCAILVTDGIDSSLPVLAALNALRLDHPSRLIVATPVARYPAAAAVIAASDHFVALVLPYPFEGSVQAYYRDPLSTDDATVLRELERVRGFPQAPLSRAPMVALDR